MVWVSALRDFGDGSDWLDARDGDDLCLAGFNACGFQSPID